MNKKVVVSLCDYTGIMVKPWAQDGYECYCVDIQHSIRKDIIDSNIHYVWGDVRGWLPPESIRGKIGIVFAFPPCTHVAVSGARDFRKKGNCLLRDSLELFSVCEQVAAWSGAPYMIENPVGKFSDHMGAPDYMFQPWQFGDLWSKKTCLWTGNGFIMPDPIYENPPEGTTQAIWKMPPSKDRANKRSITPTKFAQAVYDSNKKLLAI